MHLENTNQERMKLIRTKNTGDKIDFVTYYNTNDSNYASLFHWKMSVLAATLSWSRIFGMDPSWGGNVNRMDRFGFHQATIVICDAHNRLQSL